MTTAACQRSLNPVISSSSTSRAIVTSFSELREKAWWGMVLPIKENWRGLTLIEASLYRRYGYRNFWKRHGRWVGLLASRKSRNTSRRIGKHDCPHLLSKSQ